MVLKFVLSVSISLNVKISLPIFICDQFYALQYFVFFWSNQHFALSLWPNGHFC